MIFKNPSDALDYLFTSTDYEKMSKVRYNLTTFDLTRMERLLDGLGNPEKKIISAHIAGTKGKGSTAEMLAGIASLTGARTGIYTSPHLVDLAERIRIGAEQIPERDIHLLVENIYPVRESMKSIAEENDPTFFEMLTAMAILYFSRKKVDLAVLEVGLGGRIDSTNVVTPAVTAITVIDFDHTQQLGRTLEKIAYEKAGIIKQNIPAVIAPQDAQARRVILKQANQKKAPIIEVGRDVQILPASGNTFSVKTSSDLYENLSLNLIGDFQRLNAAVAIAMAEVLREKAVLHFNREAVKKALAGVRLPARIEMIKKNPFLVLDGAHNPVSARQLRKAITSALPFKRLHLVIGMSADKDVDKFLDEILPADTVICTGTGSPRAMPPRKLAEKVRTHGIPDVTSAEHPAEALKRSMTLAEKEDLVLITGSFYLAGEIKKHLAARPL